MSVHVIRRGNNRGAIVRDDIDYPVLLKFVEHAAADRGVSVHGYVVMTNHYHLILTPHESRALPRMMKAIGERYTHYYNRKYDRIGPLWSGRYRGIVIADELYWLTCLRYIEQFIDQQLELSGDVTVLVGPNDAGKTGLLTRLIDQHFFERVIHGADQPSARNARSSS